MKVLTNFIVVLAWLGYVACNVYILYMAWFDTPVDNKNVLYLASALTGLVGGIVATAFGIETDDSGSTRSSTLTLKAQNLAGMVVSKSTNNFLGMLYLWGYVVVGCLTAAVWLKLGADVPDGIASMAVTFVGMLLAIVIAYFKNNPIDTSTTTG